MLYYRISGSSISDDKNEQFTFQFRCGLIVH
jgi:hypothetical protein